MQNNSLVADFAKKRYYPTCLNVLLGNSGALRKVPVGLEVDLNYSKMTVYLIAFVPLCSLSPLFTINVFDFHHISREEQFIFRFHSTLNF